MRAHLDNTWGLVVADFALPSLEDLRLRLLGQTLLLQKTIVSGIYILANQIAFLFF